MKFKVCFQTVPNPDFLKVDVDQELHTRGTDFRIYRNDWRKGSPQESQFQDEDSQLLRSIVTTLLNSSTSGVREISVRSFGLGIMKGSRAVSLESIKEQVLEAAREAGYEPELVDQDDC